MPARSLSTNERLSSLEATVAALVEYQHERWHKLANDMQPLVALPERLARERGEDRGQSEGRLNAAVKQLELTITEAVEKAIEPLAVKQSDHEKRIDVLEKQGNILTGAKLLGIFVMQTFIAAATALAGAYELTRGTHP